MKLPDASNKTWPWLAVGGLAVAAVLIVMTMQSLVRVFNASPATQTTGESVPSASGPATSRPNPESISVAGVHPFVHPVTEPASPPPAGRVQPAPTQKHKAFNTNFNKIQEQEKERRAVIANMRKKIRTGNTDTNIIMQQEKKLKKIEESGESFM